jgi:serine O-acetyltransferase
MAKPSIGQQLLLPKYQLGKFIAVQRWLVRRRVPGHGWMCSWLSWVVHALYGCEIAGTARIPRSVRFPHPTGIVIGAGVTLGERVTVYQNVTLGSHGKPGVAAGYPTIGDDTTIYAGAVIVGNVSIGAGCVIGSNAVLAVDLPAGAVVLAAKPTIRGTETAAKQD